MRSTKSTDLIGHIKFLPRGQLNGCSVTKPFLSLWRVWLASLGNIPTSQYTRLLAIITSPQDSVMYVWHVYTVAKYRLQYTCLLSKACRYKHLQVASVLICTVWVHHCSLGIFSRYQTIQISISLDPFLTGRPWEQGYIHLYMYEISLKLSPRHWVK